MKKTILLLGVIVLTQLSSYADVTPFVTKVLEFKPAPGQFCNTLTTAYEEGYTTEQVCAKAEEFILSKSALLSLGAFGGYIVVGFDHPILNKKDAYDFKVHGNAFQANAVKDKKGGSCEPGVIFVSEDVNNNGKADDPWYEIAGSEHTNKSTIQNYEVTYHRPETETGDVKWVDNKGHEGVVLHNIFHSQAYYPKWLEADSYTVKGTKLPDNGENVGTEDAPYWFLSAYDWGYADNGLNNDETSNIKLDWAVDADGNPANLNKIDFVKVQSGLLQNCGWLGETSTEFCNIEDLHPTLETSQNIENTTVSSIVFVNAHLTVQTEEEVTVKVISTMGTTVLNLLQTEGTKSYSLENCPKGIYVVILLDKNNKMIKQEKLVK